jgi:hypothetical protein
LVFFIFSILIVAFGRAIFAGGSSPQAGDPGLQLSAVGGDSAGSKDESVKPPPSVSESPGYYLKLTTGSTIFGELLNFSEVPRQTFRLRLEEGIEVDIPRSAVVEHGPVRREKLEYERRWPTCPDTVEAQWELAMWCRDRTLNAERDRHLRRILELDPNHAEARRLLGFFSDDGEWKTREERMRADGYVLYGGRWMLPQAVRLLEQERKIKAAQGEWKQKISRWQSWLGGNRQELARENLQQVNDPFAVDALVEALKTERRPWVRLLFVEALARIGTARAEQALAYWALADSAEEVRMTCLDHLKKRHSPAVVDYFVGKLRSADNVEVNRAAVALRQLGDSSAIGPLIEALVTTHKVKISSGNPGQISMSFGTGGTGMSVGGGPVVVTQAMQNREVLDALVALSGVNYGFDQARWRAWFAAQRRSETAVNPRRD